jgi:multidrug efflux pump subunit AcrB
MKNLVNYFLKRHLLTNVLFFGTILLAIFNWHNIGKEEMPEFASNWIRVTTIYPGAPAEDVELFVTKPLEEELKSVVGLEEVVTTSSVGVSSLRITIDDDYPDKDEVTREIKDAVLRADLPSEVRDLPKIRQFKSAEKAILDIGIYHKSKKFLDAQTRYELQKYVLSFESQLLSQKEISSIDRSHYRKPELQILVDPKENLRMELSLSEIQQQIRNNNVRVPIGSMKDRGESKVTAIHELENVESLNELILRGNYSGKGVQLGEIATIQNGFEKSNSIFKINGHEGVFLNIKKSVSTDILSAKDAVFKLIEDFKQNNKDAPIEIIMMDDESYDVVNRINIISSNGLLGFFLIILVLLFFLDVKSGFWVAMGIPFSMAFTLIIANLFGYTVNNMTLAGIIIVLGIVVDDAIIIAENISRHREEGLPLSQAALTGTLEVFKPILASIITTCVAFIPLMFFEGFFGKLVRYIPLIVILMLLGSLIESLFILPAHMSGKTPLLDRFTKKSHDKSWFHKWEAKYEVFLTKIFPFRNLFVGMLILFLAGASYVYYKNMRFVMFPREESKEVFIKVKAKPGFTRLETAKAIAPIEQLAYSDKKNVVGVRSSIGLSRRGGEVKENEASILVELHPADSRPTPLNKLLKNWEEKSKSFENLDSVRFLRGRWGHSSGNAIELQIQENNDQNRDEIAKQISEAMKSLNTLVDVEIDKPIRKKEYLFKLRQDQLIKFDVPPSRVTSTLRSFVEGSILYSINKGEEEVDVRLTVPDHSKADLNEIYNLRVENSSGQLIYLKNIVEIKEIERPVNIKRTDYKRSTMIYANIKEGIDKTPLEIASDIEENIFPKILNSFPTTILKFRGEIEDSRESQGEFLESILMVLILIYLILIIMLNSLFKPLLVLSIIPFGIAGVVLVLLLHGMSIYGFFAAIGALGMIGVVINDSIVMIDKIENNHDDHKTWSLIAKIASTRLRPVLVTTITTVVGILPTAYGMAGYDSMLAEMMLTMGWGLFVGMFITLILIPILYTYTTHRK